MGFKEIEPGQFFIDRAVAILRESAAKHYKYVELYRGDMSQVVLDKPDEISDGYTYVPIASEKARDALAKFLAHYQTKDFYVP